MTFRTAPPAPYEKSSDDAPGWAGWLIFIVVFALAMVLGENLKPVAYIASHLIAPAEKKDCSKGCDEEVVVLREPKEDHAGTVYTDWQRLATDIQDAIIEDRKAQGKWCKVNLVVRFDKTARSNVDVDYLYVSCPGIERY